MKGISSFQELLACVPSKEGWEAICAELDKAIGSDLLPQMLSEAKIAMEKWPDDLKMWLDDWDNDSREHPAIELAVLKKRWALGSYVESSSLKGFDFSAFEVQSIAYSDETGYLAVAGADSERVCVILENDLVTADLRPYVWDMSGRGAASIRCEKLCFWGQGRSLLMVFNAYARPGSGRAKIVLLKESQEIIEILEPSGEEEEPLESFNEVITCIDENRNRLYYYFWNDKSLHAYDLLSDQQIVSRRIEGLYMLEVLPNGTLLAGLERGYVVELSPDDLSQRQPLFKSPISDLPVWKMGRSVDDSIWCSVHPYSDLTFKIGYENQDFFGGIYFWELLEGQKGRQIASFPFEEVEMGLAGSLNPVKVLSGMNDVAVVYSASIPFLNKERLACDFRICKLSLKQPVQMLKLHAASLGYVTEICLNSDDGSNRIFLGIGTTIYEWLPTG